MSGVTRATPRLKSIQRVALTMLVCGGVINYIDRATLAVANPLIREDLHLNIADMGYLLSAFLWSYAFSQLPTGAMVDKLGPRILLALGLGLWSIAQVVGGLVNSFGQFFGARLALGIGEAPQFPTGARVARDWFNARDRGLATGIFNCASSLGTAIAVPLLTFLMLSFGWRTMFIIMGVAGIAMALIWYIVYRNPTEVALTEEENHYRTEGDPPGERTKVTWREWKLLFRFRSTWGMIPGLFRLHLPHLDLHRLVTRPISNIDRHMSHQQDTGMGIAAIPFAFGVVGGVLGGYLGGRAGFPRRLADEEPALSLRASRCSARPPARSRPPMSRATRWRSSSSPARCSWCMSPALVPGRSAPLPRRPTAPPPSAPCRISAATWAARWPRR